MQTNRNSYELLSYVYWESRKGKIEIYKYFTSTFDVCKMCKHHRRTNCYVYIHTLLLKIPTFFLIIILSE